MRTGTPGFVAARLIEGREARGLSQTSLGRLSGIKPQSISHYEQGRQSPSPEALASLSSVLGLPNRFFLREAPAPRRDGIFFRRQAGHLKPRARVRRIQAQRRMAWAQEITAYLRRFVELPYSGLPDHPIDFASDQVDAVAQSVRIALKAGNGPVDNLLVTMESAGCIVVCSLEQEEVDLSYSHWDGDVPFVFLAGNVNAPSRTRYAAAHELGHLVMHRHAAEWELNDAATHQAMERQADRFARALLLPSQSFSKEVWDPSVNVLLTLRRDWGCPLSAMITRCGETGVFDENQLRRAAASLVRRGWNMEEPGENDVSREAPELLAGSIRLLVEEGRKDKHAILTELALPAADIEELCGLPAGYFAAPQTHPPLRLRDSELLRVNPPDVVIA